MGWLSTGFDHWIVGMGLPSPRHSSFTDSPLLAKTSPSSGNRRTWAGSAIVKYSSFYFELWKLKCWKGIGYRGRRGRRWCWAVRRCWFRRRTRRNLLAGRRWFWWTFLRRRSVHRGWLWLNRPPAASFHFLSACSTPPWNFLSVQISPNNSPNRLRKSIYINIK